MLGLVVSEDSSSHYYLCMARDLNFGGRFAFTAATGVAIYRSGSEGLHLGGEALFRSGLEFSVQINERLEVGATIYHLSNGGLRRENPGTESLTLGLRYTP